MDWRKDFNLSFYLITRSKIVKLWFENCNIEYWVYKTNSNEYPSTYTFLDIHRINVLHLTIQIPLLLTNWSLKIQLTLKMNDDIRIDTYHSTARTRTICFQLTADVNQYPNMYSVYHYYLFMHYNAIHMKSQQTYISNEQWAVNKSRKRILQKLTYSNEWKQSISKWFVWIQWAMHEVSILIRSFFVPKNQSPDVKKRILMHVWAAHRW